MATHGYMHDSHRSSADGGIADSGGVDQSGSVGTASPNFVAVDEVFEALDHTRRRYLLYSLHEADAPQPLPDVAHQIAAWERDELDTEVSDTSRRDVATSLFHVHIPKLVSLGIVEFDKGAKLIRPGTNTEQVQAFIDDSTSSFDEVEAAHDRYARAHREDDC
jgi:hypothetical protein